MLPRNTQHEFAFEEGDWRSWYVQTSTVKNEKPILLCGNAGSWQYKGMPLILLLLTIMTGCGYGSHLKDVQQRAPEVAVVQGAYLSLSRCMFEELDKQAAQEQAIVYQWREEPNGARLVAYTPAMENHYVLTMMPTISANFELRFTQADPTTTRLEFRSADQELYGGLVQPVLDTCNKGTALHKGAAAVTGFLSLPPALNTAS